MLNQMFYVSREVTFHLFLIFYYDQTEKEFGDAFKNKHIKDILKGDGNTVFGNRLFSFSRCLNDGNCYLNDFTEISDSLPITQFNWLENIKS